MLASFLSTRLNAKRTPTGVLFALEAPLLHRPVLCRRRRQNPVRIRRSKIGKLACQAQSARILACGEYPSLSFFYFILDLNSKRNS